MRCPKCNGFKKISDLGFVKKQCPECLGVGHVKDEPELNSTGSNGHAFGYAAPEEIAEENASTNSAFSVEKKTRSKSKLTETIQELGA